MRGSFVTAWNSLFMDRRILPFHPLMDHFFHQWSTNSLPNTWNPNSYLWMYCTLSFVVNIGNLSWATQALVFCFSSDLQSVWSVARSPYGYLAQVYFFWHQTSGSNIPCIFSSSSLEPLQNGTRGWQPWRQVVRNWLSFTYTCMYSWRYDCSKTIE